MLDNRYWGGGGGDTINLPTQICSPMNMTDDVTHYLE